MQPHERKKVLFTCMFFLLKFYGSTITMTVMLEKFTFKMKTGTHSKLYSGTHAFNAVHSLYMHFLHQITSSFTLYLGKKKKGNRAGRLLGSGDALRCPVVDFIISERCYQLVICRDFHTLIDVSQIATNLRHRVPRKWFHSDEVGLLVLLPCRKMVHDSKEADEKY